MSNETESILDLLKSDKPFTNEQRDKLLKQLNNGDLMKVIKDSLSTPLNSEHGLSLIETQLNKLKEALNKEGEPKGAVQISDLYKDEDEDTDEDTDNESVESSDEKEPIKQKCNCAECINTKKIDVKKTQFNNILQTLTNKCCKQVTADLNDTIQKYKDYIFGYDILGPNNRTMLQLCVGKNTVLFDKLITHSLCTYDYISILDINGFDAITLLYDYNTVNFLNFMESIFNSYKTLPVYTYINDNIHKYLFKLLSNKNYDNINKLLTLIPNYNCTCKYWSHSPQQFAEYIPLTYILDNSQVELDNGKTFNQLFVEITTNEKFNLDVFINLFNTMIKSKNYVTILTIYTLITNSEMKKWLINKVYNSYDLFHIKCLKNIVLEYIIIDPSILKKNNRLHLILCNRDKIQLRTLLTSENFTKDEYFYIDTGNRNCINMSLLSNGFGLDMLIEHEMFNIKLLKNKDYDNHDIKWYIQNYCPENKVAKSIYGMLYGDPDLIEEGDEEQDITCKICFENKVNIVLAPCGHTHCSKCIDEECIECPFCHERIRDYMRVRFS